MENTKLVCRVLLQDWITFKALALEDRSRIMNEIAEDKYARLLSQLINTCVTRPQIIKEVATLIFDKAILEPTFCPMYAKLCSDIQHKLPTFLPRERGAGKITENTPFKGILLNLCQQLFEEHEERSSQELRKMNGPYHKGEPKEMERMSNLRAIGNLRLIGELLKQHMVTVRIGHHIVQKLLGDEEKMCPSEENVEAVCLFLKTVGKELDGSSSLSSKKVNDKYYRRLKELSNNSQLVMRLRFMIRNIINLRSNGWISRPEVTNPAVY
ncbi:unnamed protein product [Thlaspi arvense]|uniref:MIF4G domain-containing protein n=1 Tax=Thlaspi arvense TaxID=13288 RepID=A0AAU9RW78_THLAR|nr:unnamed protein product [Thlaspi arvense]